MKNDAREITGMITIKNNFHGTEVRLRVKVGILSKGQLQKADRELCGMHGCACGSWGRQGDACLSDGRRVTITPWHYETACVDLDD